MINIIKADLYRIIRSKSLYIVIAIIVIVTLISTIAMQPGNIGIGLGKLSNEYSSILNEHYEELSKTSNTREFRAAMKSFGAFKLDKEMISQNMNLYYVFIVIAVLIICVDFSNKTVKNTISSSISKKTYYLSKLFTTVGICTFITLFTNFLNFFLNRIINGNDYSSEFIEIIKITLFQLPLIYGTIGLLVGIAFCTRRLSTFNAIAISIIMVFQIIITSIMGIFRVNFEWVEKYELQIAIAKLANNPSKEYILKCALLGITYFIVFNLIGYYSFKKSETK